jgi:hypothetical protein
MVIRRLRASSTCCLSGVRTARPPLLAQALVACGGGQASLVFDGATRYGGQDSISVIGVNGVASSQGPDLGNQTVRLHTEAGAGRPFLTDSRLNDGFAGTIGELLCAIEYDREPWTQRAAIFPRSSSAGWRCAPAGQAARLPSERTRTRNRRRAVAVRL